MTDFKNSRDLPSPKIISNSRDLPSPKIISDFEDIEDSKNSRDLPSPKIISNFEDIEDIEDIEDLPSSEIIKSHPDYYNKVRSVCRSSSYNIRILNVEEKKEILLYNKQNYKLYRNFSPPDGSCLIYSILQIIRPDEYINKSNRFLSLSYRNELSSYLSEKNKYYPDYNNWSVINNSSLMINYITSYNIDYIKSLKQFQNELNNPNEYLGQDSIALISEKENIDIYTIRICTHGFIDSITSIYKTPLQRKAIIIANVGGISNGNEFIGNHYEPIFINEDKLLDYNNPTHMEVLKLLQSQYTDNSFEVKLDIDDIIINSIIDINNNAYTYIEPNFDALNESKNQFINESIERYLKIISQPSYNNNENLKDRIIDLNIPDEFELNKIDQLSNLELDDNKFIQKIMEQYKKLIVKIPYFSKDNMENNQLFYDKYIELMDNLVMDNNTLNIKYLEEKSPIIFYKLQKKLSEEKLDFFNIIIVNDNYNEFKDFVIFLSNIDKKFSEFKQLDYIFNNHTFEFNKQLSILKIIDLLPIINDDTKRILTYLFNIFKETNKLIMKHLNNNNFYLNIKTCIKSLYKLNIFINNIILLNVIFFILHNKSQSINNMSIVSSLKNILVRSDKNSTMVLNELVLSIKIDDINIYK